jgi:hypothetical protein
MHKIFVEIPRFFCGAVSKIMAIFLTIFSRKKILQIQIQS